MIEFNHVANSLVKKYYEQLRTAKPNVPVNKFDVEKLVNESQEMQFFNKIITSRSLLLQTQSQEKLTRKLKRCN